MKITILYGSTTGTTEHAASVIKDNLSSHEVVVKSVVKAVVSDVSEADLILLGSSTWGYGDLQDDFEAYMDKINSSLYSGKKVAVFGCGDQTSFADVFCEAVSIIEEKVTSAGGELQGEGLRIDGLVDDHLDEIKTFINTIL